MADKSFIEFRLDPDNIKEELSQLIPYYETLKYYHENPDAPISETAKVAAQETPILGSILRGEPVNAAKEAIIMGMPIPQNDFKVFKRSGIVPITQYDVVRDLYKKNAKNLQGKIYIDKNGEYIVKDPNSNYGFSADDLKNLTNENKIWYRKDLVNSPIEYYDATPQNIADTYNEYRFIIDNLSEKKLNKVRRYGSAGEDIKVGRKTYKPAEFYDTYRTLLEDIESYQKMYNGLLNNSTKHPELIAQYGLKLKKLEQQKRMMEQADMFTNEGPYLNMSEGVDAYGNTMPDVTKGEQTVIDAILKDNSKKFIDEYEYDYTDKNPYWANTMRRYKENGSYKK